LLYPAELRAHIAELQLPKNTVLAGREQLRFSTPTVQLHLFAGAYWVVIPILVVIPEGGSASAVAVRLKPA
jgi:hypothetical protein